MNIIRVLIKQVIHDKRYIFYLMYCFIYIYIGKIIFKQMDISEMKFVINIYVITIIGMTNLVCLDLLEIEKRLKIQEILFSVGKKTKSYLHIRNIIYCIILNIIISIVYLLIGLVLFQILVLSPIDIVIANGVAILIYFLDYYTEYLKVLTTFTRSLIRNFIILGAFFVAVKII